MAGFRSIVAWQKADDLAVLVYQITKAFPGEERYGLTSQIRRAAVSVPANIAGGISSWGRVYGGERMAVAWGSKPHANSLLVSPLMNFDKQVR